MILTLFFAVIFGVFLIFYLFSNQYSYESDILHVFTWVFGVFFAFVILFIPVSNYTITTQIERFEIRKETVHIQRAGVQTEYERAMLTTQLMEDNAWLVAIQRHKKGVFFNWYVPKEILDVEPIQ